MSFNDELLDNWITQRVDLLRVAEGTRSDVLSHLKVMEEDLVEQIARADLAGIASDTSRVRRLEKLLEQTRDTMQTAYRKAGTTLNGQLLDIADIEQRAAVNLWNDVFESNVAQAAFSRKQLEQVIKAPVDGTPLEDWWSRQDQKTRMSVERELRLGTTAGETNEDMVRRIRGRSTGRRRVIDVDGEKRVVRETTGGVMEISKRDASTLVRTSVQNTSNQVHEAVYEENRDLLRGRKALVTLDSRTSKICMARSGGAWDMDGKPLPESTRQEPFPGAPPWHPNCRTVLSPITKSWEQLIEEKTGKKVKGLKEIDSKVRASMDGQVPGDLNYETWLRRKDKASPGFADQMLGPQRAKMWREGKLTTHDLIDQSGRPLTVNELRARVDGGAVQAIRRGGGVPDIEPLGAPLPPDGQFKDVSQVQLTKWMGRNGYSKAEVTKVFDEMGVPINKNTLNTQLSPKRLASGTIVDLTPAQVAELEQLAGRTLKIADFSEYKTTQLMKWMGRNGFSKDEVADVLGKLGFDVNKNTLNAQLSPKRLATGTPVKLTGEQEKSLLYLRGGKKLPPKPPIIKDPDLPPPPPPPKPKKVVVEPKPESVKLTDLEELKGGRSTVYKGKAGDKDVVYKPIAEEVIQNGDNPFGFEYEKAARLVDEAAGFDQTPATHIVDGPKGPGTVKEFVKGDTLIPGIEDLSEADYFDALDNFDNRSVKATKDARTQSHVFDIVIGNVDDVVQNTLITEDGKAKLIDAGSAFISNSGIKKQGIANPFGDMMGVGAAYHDKLPEPIVEGLQKLLDKRAELERSLTRFMSRQQVDEMYDRIELVLRHRNNFQGLATAIKEGDGLDELPDRSPPPRTKDLPTVYSLDETDLLTHNMGNMHPAIKSDQRMRNLYQAYDQASPGTQARELARKAMESRLKVLVKSSEVEDYKRALVGAAVKRARAAGVFDTPGTFNDYYDLVKKAAKKEGLDFSTMGGDDFVRLMKKELRELKVDSTVASLRNEYMEVRNRYWDAKEAGDRSSTSLYNTMRTKERKYLDAKKKLGTHADVQKNRVHDALKVSEKQRAKIKVKEGNSGMLVDVDEFVPSGSEARTIHSKTEEAATWLSERLHRDAYQGALKSVDVHAMGVKTSRVYARTDKHAIYVNGHTKQRVYVHEVAHVLEAGSKLPYGKKPVQHTKKFLQYRRTSETPKKISVLTGNRNYRDHEVAFEDKFKDPYTGKYYSHATEILSMGLEEMYANPVEFLEQDPEFFEFLVDLLRGKADEFFKRKGI